MPPNGCWYAWSGLPFRLWVPAARQLCVTPVSWGAFRDAGFCCHGEAGFPRVSAVQSLYHRRGGAQGCFLGVTFVGLPLLFTFDMCFGFLGGGGL
jgi:hypothetical protein